MNAVGGDESQGLIGRKAELAAIGECIRELSLGRGGALWIEGEPGIGKSALLDLLGQRARRNGARWAGSAGDELLQGVPLRLMASCLEVSARSPDPDRVEIAVRLRGMGESGRLGISSIAAVQERMLAVVERMCAVGPTVLAADDLQWADEASLDVWARLTQTTVRLPLLLVGAACRDAGTSTAAGAGAYPGSGRAPQARLREAAAAVGGRTLELTRLDAHEVLDLTGALVAGAVGPRLGIEVERAGGNPLYLRSLIDSLVGEELVAVVDGVAEYGGEPGAVPPSLLAVVGRRLVALRPQTSRTLRIAALLGGEFDAARLANAAGLPLDDVRQALAEGVDAGVLAAAGDRVAFGCALVADVLRAQLPVAIRQSFHRQIARSLAAGGAGFGQVAGHLSAASRALEPWTLDWLADTPPVVLAQMPEHAVELLREAVRAVGTDDARWEPLAVRWAEALFVLGRDEEVVELAHEVRRSVANIEAVARVTVLHLRSATRLGWSKSWQALRAADRVLADPDLPDRWRARVRACSAEHVYGAEGSQAKAGTVAAAALTEALASGDAQAIAESHYASFRFAGGEDPFGHLDAALEALDGLVRDRGDGAAAGPEHDALRILLTVERLTGLFFAGRFDEYQSALPSTSSAVERLGTAHSGPLVTGIAGLSFVAGAWDEALDQLGRLVPGRSSKTHRLRGHAVAATILLRRGRRPDAAPHLAAIEESFADVVGALRVPDIGLRTAQAFAAEVDGNPARALDLMAEALASPTDGSGVVRDWAVPHLVRLALEAGDLATARAATEALEADAARSATLFTITAAKVCRGQLEGDAELLATVAGQARDHGWTVCSSFASEESAVRLAAAGDGTSGRNALASAVREYERMGASWDVRRAEARLRMHGVRLGRRGVRRRDVSGWGALTDGETDVARLVALGCSNPEIASRLYLSRNTVQTHVSSVLAKLQVASRAEIVREARSRLRTGWPDSGL